MKSLEDGNTHILLVVQRYFLCATNIYLEIAEKRWTSSLRVACCIGALNSEINLRGEVYENISDCDRLLVASIRIIRENFSE